MARAERKHHYIYKITYKVTNRFYIGMHSTDNMDDGYFGSGKRLWFSINYHGKENHEKEILEFCSTRAELKKREKEIVTKELLQEDLCMNLKEGGDGGFINEEHMLKCSKAGNEAFSKKLINDLEFRKSHIERLLVFSKKYRDSGIHNYNTFEGKTHSVDSKEKIRIALTGQRTGVKNTQYGTCWITKDGENKKIKKEKLDSYLIDGWIKGRNLV